MKNCLYCSKEIRDQAAFCNHCGREQPAPETPPKIRPASRNAWIGAGVLAFSFLVSLMTNGMRPTTQLEALIPGLIIGLAGWVAIIMFGIAIVQAVLNRRER